MDKSNQYFPALDGLRALSMLSVLSHHLWLGFPFILPANTDVLTVIASRFCKLGVLGVDFFFVISGFLITGLLAEDLGGKIRVKRFYLRRAFKILPQYFAAVMVSMAFNYAYLHEIRRPITYVSYFLMFQNYVVPLGVLGHLWSIAVEEHFYFVLPCVFWAVTCLTKDVRQRRMFIVWILLLAIFAGNWARFVSFQGLGLEDLYKHHLWQYTHVRFDALIFGCLLRFVYENISQRKQWIGMIRIVFLILGATLFVFVFNTYSSVLWWSHTLVYISSGLLMMSGVLGFRPLCAILDHPWLKFLGQCSYGIYLWHYILILLFLDFYLRTGFKWLAAAYVVVACVFGIATTKTLEAAFLKLRQRVVP